MCKPVVFGAATHGYGTEGWDVGVGDVERPAFGTGDYSAEGSVVAGERPVDVELTGEKLGCDRLRA